MKEIWKDIVGFEGLYQVSNYGRIKSLCRLIKNNGGMQRRHERILKQNISNGRYYIVVLCKDGKTYPKLVHRLVAEAYIPNIDNKPVVDHIDTNVKNNCANNLRWVTTKENCLNPLTKEKNSNSKKGHPYYGRNLTEEERAKIRKALTGIKLSDEHKKKLSESHKSSKKSLESSMNNLVKARQTNIGKKRTEDTKNKIREKMIGKHKGKHWKLVDGKRVWY